MKLYQKPIFEVKEVRSALDFAAITDGPLANFMSQYGEMLEGSDEEIVTSYTYSSAAGLTVNP